ncbi:MAG: hypothetical protein H7Z37_06400, partial [Pyrinomonadaceae bacterium]|nr:hypothetical protein [Pyrinomonadaceae bacterium]
TDALIQESGKIAAKGFHRVVVREDKDLRGRGYGESARILYEAIAAEVPDCDCKIIMDESDALKREITVMREGDILVCFYENFDVVRAILERAEAVPTNQIKHLSYKNFELAQA